MPYQPSNSKRIAKNTLMLYFRMALIMLVTLFTSRVILNALGVVDFGIYNVVAGVVVLFSFLNSALMNASQRYLSIAVETEDSDNIQKVFSTCMLLHLLICVVLIVLAETIGLWFLNDKLSIPADRIHAANWVYQSAVLCTCINVLRVPYHSMIIAEEDMSFFAYLSIFETILKLGIAYLILVIAIDRLISYSLLLLLVTLLVSALYAYKCHRSYSIRFSFKPNNNLIKEIALFSGWNILGGVADVGYKQGTNMILNVFSGVTLNAAMGIAVQVRAAVYSFVTNLQIAANPQIIKSYNNQEYDRYENLVYSISKYSFFLILLLAFPIMLNMHVLLDFWLKTPPDYAYSFCTLTLIFCLVDSLSGPLWTSMQAMGNIRNYQIIISILLLLNLPFTYVALSKGMSPESLLYIQIVICAVSIFVRLLFSRHYARLTIKSYIRNVMIPIIGVVLISLPVPFLLALKLTGLPKLFITVASSFVITCISIWLVGLKYDERKFVVEFIKSKLGKR